MTENKEPDEFTKFAREQFTMGPSVIHLSSAVDLLALTLNSMQPKTTIDSAYLQDIVTYFNTFQTMCIQSMQKVNATIDRDYKKKQEENDGTDSTETAEPETTEGDSTTTS